MATRIRLARGGSKKRPYYRVVIADKRAKRDGRFVERIGSYNPLLDENKCTIDKARAEYWLSVGASPSERVTKLLRLSGIDIPPALVPKRLRPGGAAETSQPGKKSLAQKAKAAQQETAPKKAEAKPAEKQEVPKKAPAKAEAAPATEVAEAIVVDEKDKPPKSAAATEEQAEPEIAQATAAGENVKLEEVAGANEKESGAEKTAADKAADGDSAQENGAPDKPESG